MDPIVLKTLLVPNYTKLMPENMVPGQKVKKVIFTGFSPPPNSCSHSCQQKNKLHSWFTMLIHMFTFINANMFTQIKIVRLTILTFQGRLARPAKPAGLA